MIDIYTIAKLIGSRGVLHTRKDMDGLPVWSGYSHKDFEFEFVGNSRGKLFGFRYWNKDDQRKKSPCIRLIDTWTKITIKHHFMSSYSDIAMSLSDTYPTLYSTRVDKYFYSSVVEASRVFKFWKETRDVSINMSYLAPMRVLDEATEAEFEKSTYCGVHICDRGFTPNRTNRRR